jgi:hypothetical protein
MDDLQANRALQPTPQVRGSTRTSGASMDSGLLVAVILFLIAGGLFGISFAARRRAPAEMGLVPVCEQMCSGRVGWFMGANYPAIRLSLYDAFLVVGFFGPVVVPYTDIVRAEIQSVLFSSRLVIQTKRGITFRLSVKDPQYVLKLLRRT